jgi:putative spermidine/putrescine transport system substrate-binding protein
MRKTLLPICLFLIATALYGAGGREGGAADEEPHFEDRFPRMSWDQIVDEARGSELFWYMWGGSDSINRFVQGYVADRLREEYEIRLEMVPVSDASVFVSQVLGEQQAGRTRGGSVDVMWINGENFRSMRENELLFGPYADVLPNMQYVDIDDPTVANDFGFPVDGYESPYGSAQMVMVYDQARVPSPPSTIPALLDWVEENPGRFTYPSPPDFTGSAFVRHIFYHVAGGYEQLLGEFDLQLFEEVAAETWALLNEIEPMLWRGGRTYPESLTQQQTLFANSEVDFAMNYNPAAAANFVAQGRFPESTRTYVFDSGMIGNTHYLAIPSNASHKAAALVLANLVLDPALQYEKALPEVWGDLPVVSVSRLPQRWQDRFENLPRPPAVLSPSALQAARLPELQSTWLEAIERGWIENVLQQ